LVRRGGLIVVVGFDHDRFRQVRINEVYPYAFWVWEVPNGRRGGMVCFRGHCRAGDEGHQDVRIVGWWMGEYFRAAGGVDGLVVDTWELGGDWHDDLTFLPAGVPLPPSFRVLYSVLGPHSRDRGTALWGEDRIRDDLDVALAERDGYLGSLPPVTRPAEPHTTADGGREVD
jgi:hypothetical protein